MSDDSHIQSMLFTAATYECEAAQRKASVAEMEMSTALEQNRPFFLLKPRVFPDGNQWCALYGENIQEGVCAFGDTPAQAAIQFDVQWLGERAGPLAATPASPATAGEAVLNTSPNCGICGHAHMIGTPCPQIAAPIEAEAQKPAPLHAYLSKLPALDPTWPAQVQEGWMKCFDALRAMSGAEAQKAVAWISLPDFQALARRHDGYQSRVHRDRIASNDIPLYSAPTSSASTEALTDEEVADAIIRDVGELPDYTSPDDCPDALMATAGELRTIILGHLSGERGAR